MLNKQGSPRSSVALFAALEWRMIDEMARAARAAMRLRFGLPAPRPDERVSEHATANDPPAWDDPSKTSPEDEVC